MIIDAMALLTVSHSIDLCAMVYVCGEPYSEHKYRAVVGFDANDGVPDSTLADSIVSSLLDSQNYKPYIKDRVYYNVTQVEDFDTDIDFPVALSYDELNSIDDVLMWTTMLISGIDDSMPSDTSNRAISMFVANCKVIVAGINEDDIVTKDNPISSILFNRE